MFRSLMESYVISPELISVQTQNQLKFPANSTNSIVLLPQSKKL